MTNKINIAGQLHDTSGLTLPDREFREFWKEPVDGVVEIDLDAALPAFKSKLSRQVDDDAEAFRMKILTPGAGMAMTYREKLDQATSCMTKSMIEPEGEEPRLQTDAERKAEIDALTPEQQVAMYPTLAASVGLEAATLWDVANLVASKAEQWASLSYMIESKRLGGKSAIDQATTLEDVQAAYDAITWS